MGVVDDPHVRTHLVARRNERTFSSNVILAPKTMRGMALLTNQGDTRAGRALRVIARRYMVNLASGANPGPK